jgi:hypothetical protein
MLGQQQDPLFFKMISTKYKRKIISKEKFFKGWSPQHLEKLTSYRKNKLYCKYLIKHLVFNRDNFKCQNLLCCTPYSEITIHRIKFGKNGGHYIKTNCVTMCESCQTQFHKGLLKLKLSKSFNLPKKIRGHTFKVLDPKIHNWKGLKQEYKEIKFRIMVEIYHKKSKCLNSKFKIILKCLWLRLVELLS